MLQDPGKARARQVIKRHLALPSAWNDSVLRLTGIDGLFSVSGHACLTSVRAATRIRWLGPVPLVGWVLRICGLVALEPAPHLPETPGVPHSAPPGSLCFLCPSRCVRRPRLGPARTSPPAAPCWCANDLTLIRPGLPMKRSRCRSTPRCRLCGRWDPRSGSPSSCSGCPRWAARATSEPSRSGGNRNTARDSPCWSAEHAPDRRARVKNWSRAADKA